MIRVVLVIAALLVGACGEGEPAFTEDNLAEELVDAGLLDETAADCVAGQAFAEFTPEERAEIETIDLDGDAALPPEVADAITDAIGACVTGS